jgi:DMSO/TMAO reductase YedYZ molybdopterin-dependent catalytic subunit
MPTFLQDVRIAIRTLRKAPAFALGAALVLALAIGATTAIFSLVDAALLRPLPFRDAGRLVRLFERSPQTPRSQVAFSDFEDWRDQNHSFAGFAGAMVGGQTSLTDGSGAAAD